MVTHFLQRRLAFRKPANVPAWIEKEGNRLLERCTLVDVSDKGARLTISDVHDLPEQFHLYLARAPLACRQCRVIWQRHHEVGVEFLIS
jgi:PilZ domain